MKFKAQGIKKHETSCKKLLETEEEQQWFNQDYERGQQKEKKACRALRLDISKAGPSNLARFSKSRSDASDAHADNHDVLPVPEEQLEFDSNVGITSPVLSDASMATINPAPAASAQLPSKFKLRIILALDAPIVDKEPWHPFRSCGDFEFSEIAIKAALNKSQINALLSLITHISEGHAQITLKNEANLSKAWDNAAAELTPFSKYKVAVTYKKNEQVYEVHAKPIWDWALDLFDNPLLAPHFVWDACHDYKHNGVQFKCFFNEPWTGDRWWDIQSSLPDIDGTVPFCFILYADKTKLSSFGTVKGYPVMNGEAFGGGRIVRWLLIVPEDACEEVSPSSPAHPVQLPLPIEKVHDVAHTWPQQQVPLPHIHCGSKEVLDVYKRSKAQGEELLKALGLWPVENIFWIICLWKHLLGELKKILASLGREAEAAFEKLIDDFPRWCNLNHFKSAINILFSDGNKFQDLSKQTLYACLNLLTPRTSPEGHQLLRVISTYLQLDSLIGLNVHTEGTLMAIKAKLLIFDMELQAYVTCAKSSDIEKLKLNWNFPKPHLWKHIVYNIQRKGAAHNYSMHPNEKLHGPLKDTYHHQTNGKDVAGQILHVNHHKFALMLLRECVDAVDKYNRLQALGNDLPDEDIAVAFSSHVKLVDYSFQAFLRKFTEFINTSLPTYGHQLTNWITFPADYQIHEHHYLKCNLQFHGLLQFDHTLIQLTADETIFVRLILLFRCSILNLGSFEFALVQPYTARINGSHRMDCFFKLTHVKALPRASSIFVPLSSFIQGAVLVPNADHQDEHLVVDHLDSDMFL
ncbi:hypothetical protein F4604DRAFT_1929797 [Suillus subluteus]|nr:hypothetical protein F4604DRAFT_1929797 [Suillus subluteus]